MRRVGHDWATSSQSVCKWPDSYSVSTPLTKIYIFKGFHKYALAQQRRSYGCGSLKIQCVQEVLSAGTAQFLMRLLPSFLRGLLRPERDPTPISQKAGGGKAGVDCCRFPWRAPRGTKREHGSLRRRLGLPPATGPTRLRHRSTPRSTARVRVFIQR